jgi:hypothetical protein
MRTCNFDIAFIRNTNNWSQVLADNKKVYGKSNAGTIARMAAKNET